ncbi:MAG: FtsX-like permease family protein [Acidiferrobacterales bacterium]|nr:FtsX-like permease family protein [Acidiferrobacterales bacterium]
MTLAQQLRFAPRLMWREWKSGEFTVLLLALIVAIASHTAIGHFSDRISRAMVTNANNLIGGDLVFSSSRPISAEVRQQAEQLGLKSAETQRFMTVASAGDEIVLVSVKSVSAEYPLKGAVRITDELFGPEKSVTSGPSRGNIWLEARVLQTLQLELGDKIQIGDSTFTANRILTYEPDRGNNFYSFNPRVMIAKEDLAATNIVQPGSRVWYRQMFAGNSDAVESLSEWLENHAEPGQRIRNLDEDRPAVSEALSKAKQYMGLASLLALLLAAVAIANSGRHYSERHYDTSALLRCLGAQQNDILRIYLIQLCLLAFIGGILGNLAGWAAQGGLFMLISDLLPENLPSATLTPAASGMALSFIVLLGFTLPSVLRLKSVSPLRVLRHDLSPYPLSALLVYGGAAVMVMMLMWFYTGNITLTLSILIGSAIVIIIAMIGIRLLFAAISWLLPSFPLRLRAGIRNFLRRRREAVSQTMAFGLTIMAMLVVVFLRTELVTTWQGTIPDDAPNHFVLNIQKDETADYEEFIQSKNIRADQLYPVIRGRLTRVNDKPMVEHVSKEERRHESLSRELNLTWSPTLPPDNKLLEGEWWDGEATSGQITKVSVEQQLAERLAIGVGDRLTFFTGDRDWEAVVSSIRSVKWDNFNPNFYMVFQPGALDDLPTTWINSFYLEPTRKKQLVDMLKQFPSITLLEMDAILNQVKTIITQVTLAIESILLFVLAAGFVVTLSAIQSSMNDRLREGALVRTLGADRKLLKINQWSEFAGMGFLSGLIGVAGAEIIVAQLYQRIFELSYVPTWWAWLFVPLFSALLVGLAGVISSRKILLQPPMQSLRTLRA